MQKRIVLKISGEILAGKSGRGIDSTAFTQIASSLKVLHSEGFQVIIVVGGGNIFRGRQAKDLGIDQVYADQMGMMATFLNGIALRETLLKMKCPAYLMSAFSCHQIADPFQIDKAKKKVEEGNILISVGGTGNPYFTTDSAAALRASELQADIVLKATKVNGVYDKDPEIHQDAKKFDRLTYKEVLEKGLKVMDATAIALCQDSATPIFVFSVKYLTPEKVMTIFSDQSIGTLINGGKL